MLEKPKFPVIVPAIRIMQPLGEFYVTKLDARLLLQVTYSDPLRAIAEVGDYHTYSMIGIQREETEKRLKEIGRYIDTVEAAFPNSIILGVNYHSTGELEEKEDKRWRIDQLEKNEFVNLVIPSDTKIARIIDGQHRLHGFNEANPERKSMELLCAVYLDLPNPYQAYLFATINFNQRKVDRSLAYELWGFNIESEPPKSWSPEKTAVFICRKLNTDQTSPLHQHIIVAAQDDNIIFQNKPKDIKWAVSTATVVDGILRLISTNPQKDKDEMHKKTIEGGRSRLMLKSDNSPLRSLYLATNDLALYITIKNFFTAVDELLWLKNNINSYITKTVGIQALFDVLRFFMQDYTEEKNVSTDYFRKRINDAVNIDFSNDFFQASGIGKTRIKNIILYKTGNIKESSLPPQDRDTYKKLAS